MATLHMETDVARETEQSLASRHEVVVSEVGGMLSAVSNLRSNWQGNSASQFFQEFEQWHSAMGKMLEELSRMDSRLGQEISQWEQTAARFE